MSDYLLELRSEEIPARMQARAREDLARLFTAELAAVGLPAPVITTYATPRRLTLIARDLPLETAAVSEEIKGPKASAPPQALEGFLRKTGLTREQLVERDGVLFAVIDKPGRATADVLAAAIPAIIRAFPWPKSMRWGAASLSTESIKWVRPLHGIVALLGDDVVPCEIAGTASGRETMGHRFHSSGPVSIESAATYADQLRDAHVIVDQDERAQIIALGATMAARKAGLQLIKDEGLLIENAGLTEWPVPLLGRFDPAFLEVPPEVIQLTARVNQKYFVCADADGKLANAFVCTANIDAADDGAGIIEGNRKVLAARLSDAKFFYDTDRKVPLEEQAKKLDRIVFHEKLGTVADKVERVAKLARWLVEEGIVTAPSPLRGEGRGEGERGAAEPALSSADHPHPTLSLKGEGLSLAELATLAERAARLCKADLVTGMVGEFPELQGLMGGYYAAAQGEDPRVAAAIRDHYKPVGAGDDVPTEPVTVAVSLADKLDTLTQFFAVDEKPTGSKDPFALRRAALGMISLAKVNGLRLSFVFATLKAVTARLVSEQLSADRAPVLKALPVLTDLVSEQTAEQIMRAIVAIVQDMPDPRKPSEVVFERALRISTEVRDFMLDRLEVSERQEGARVDFVRAAQIVDGDRGKEDDLVRLLARVHALQAFIGTADGANLLAGYKRAANILKKEGVTASNPGDRHPGLVPGATSPQEMSPGAAQWTPEQVRGDGGGENNGLPQTPHPAEAALIAALDHAEPAAAAAVAREDFEGAMAALAILRAPIDAFFESVIVNDADPVTRAARLALLARVRDAVHTVADFSRIEG